MKRPSAVSAVSLALMTPPKGQEVCFSPRAPANRRSQDGGDEPGMLQARTTLAGQPPQAPLSWAGYLDAADDQQLQSAPLYLLQIPRTTARHLGFFFPPSLTRKHHSVSLPVSTLWALSPLLKTKPLPRKVGYGGFEMMKSLKIHKASYSVFSNSVFISMETEMAAGSLLQGCNYSCSRQRQLQHACQGSSISQSQQ